jgi:hypothetical protein
MHVRNSVSYRAKSFIDGHLGSVGHMQSYNRAHTVHLYVIQTDISKETKKPNESDSTSKVNKALECGLTAAKFERHAENNSVGLRCKKCQLFVKTCNAFKGNVAQHLNKDCSSKKRKGTGESVHMSNALESANKKVKVSSGLNMLAMLS